MSLMSMGLDTYGKDDKSPTENWSQKEYSSRRTDAREPLERKIFLQEKLWIPFELEGLEQRAKRIQVHE